FLAETLVARFNFPGSLLLVAALCTIAVSLLVQSTLAEVIANWRRRLAMRWERVVLAWSRRRQRLEKEKLRKRVVSKHLKRREEEATGAIEVMQASAPLSAPEIDLPLRGVDRRADERRPDDRRADERTGERPLTRGFGVRKVRLGEEPDV